MDYGGSPAMVSRRVFLEPLGSWHINDLYALVTDERTAAFWPLNGKVPDPERFEQYLWAKSGLQYVICRRDSGSVIGLIQAIDRDARNGIVGIGLFLSPDLWRSGWPLEGIVLFLDLLFEGLGCRKVYFEMSASTACSLGGALDTWLAREVTLRDHIRQGDGYVDDHIYALFREQWDPTLLRLIGVQAPQDTWTDL
jgi:RimJ/RimL family protein N-acetyltransferase